MTADVKTFYEECFQEIHSRAGAQGDYAEDSFFDFFCDHLSDAGEIDTGDRVHYSDRGVRVDGYAGDPKGNANVLTVIVADFNQSVEVETLTATDMAATFKRLRRFVERARESKFRGEIEESAPVFGLADLISVRWPALKQVRMVLISNRKLSTRVDGIEADVLDGVPVTYSVWDITRLQRYVESGREKEELDINLVAEFGQGIRALPAHIEDGDYEAYLAVMPGDQLAAIYDRWGARLLEQNVRCFLQFRSKVNKGIRNTLVNEPEMFFAFNNGIAATAEKIQTKVTAEGLEITHMTNFQIVNGGQTTASIHAAGTDRRKAGDLSRVFVQMKLSVIEPEVAKDVVPRVSEFANSQNRVSAADFFSNHPFHVRIEEFSRRIYVPAADGTFVQSKWFYERARGQYQDARAYLTTAQRRKFDLEYPRRQMFTKTDLGKYVNVWRGQPHIVSQGAQKNFAVFAGSVGKEWDKNKDAFNEAYYRRIVAQAIIFKFTEQLVSAQPWYQGGYRANIVAYAIAKLAHHLEYKGKALDFEAIWRDQSVSDDLASALLASAEAVHAVISNPVAGIRNVTEWAKKQACWDQTAGLNVDWPKSMWRTTLGRADVKERAADAVKEQRVLNGIEAQMAVVSAGADLWEQLLAWGKENRLLSETDIGILEVASRIPKDIPSERQCQRIMSTLNRLRDEGCTLGTEVR